MIENFGLKSITSCKELKEFKCKGNVCNNDSVFIKKSCVDGCTPEKAKDFEKYLSVALEAFGSDRLMFGSDWPVCLLAGSYQHVLKIIDLFIEELSLDKQNKIMGENAINFYKL